MFNPDNLPKDFYAIAKDNSETHRDKQWATAGIILGGITTIVTGSLPLGAIVFGYGMLQGWKEVEAKNKSEEALEKYGCLAHLLGEQDLKEYIQTEGIESTLQQVEWAKKKGYALSSAANKLIKKKLQVPKQELVDVKKNPLAI